MGRPSKYKAEYCDLLIDHMSKGRSFQTFGSELGVSRDTLYEWCRVHSEFSDTKKRAEVTSLLFWERLGIDAVQGKIPGFNATIWIFTMKCRFRKYGWNENPEQVTEADKEVEKERDKLKKVPTKKLVQMLIEHREGERLRRLST